MGFPNSTLNIIRRLNLWNTFSHKTIPRMKKVINVKIRQNHFINIVAFKMNDLIKDNTKKNMAARISFEICNIVNKVLNLPFLVKQKWEVYLIYS